MASKEKTAIVLILEKLVEMLDSDLKASDKMDALTATVSVAATQLGNHCGLNKKLVKEVWDDIDVEGK